MKNKTVYSLGHSSVPIGLFILKLSQNNIDTVIDVRTNPMSRFCPQFNRNALESALFTKNILYLYRGKNLGGKGVNVDYEKTIDEISEMVKRGISVCVLCAEKDPKNCHRHTLLQPSFKKRGIETSHILYDEPKKSPKQKSIFLK